MLSHKHRRGLTDKVKSPLYILHFFFLLLVIFLSCDLFSLRKPEESGGGEKTLPLTFSDLLTTYKESFIASNINQYEEILSDSFYFRVCDRIYYSNPDFYATWDKDREVQVMQNLFLSLSMSETYPVSFDKYDVVLMDTTSADSQYARIEYRAYLYFSGGEIDTAGGFLDIYGQKIDEFWQVTLIKDYENGESPCLSDIKVKFLSGK